MSLEERLGEQVGWQRLVKLGGRRDVLEGDVDGARGERGWAHGLMRGKGRQGAGFAGSLGDDVLYRAVQCTVS